MHWWNERSLSEGKESCAFEIRRWYYRYSGAGRWGTCYTGLFEIGEAVGENPRSRIVEGGYYWISTKAGANQWPGLQACWHVGRAVDIGCREGSRVSFINIIIIIIITSPLQHHWRAFSLCCAILRLGRVGWTAQQSIEGLDALGRSELHVCSSGVASSHIHNM